MYQLAECVTVTCVHLRLLPACVSTTRLSGVRSSHVTLLPFSGLCGLGCNYMQSTEARDNLVYVPWHESVVFFFLLLLFLPSASFSLFLNSSGILYTLLHLRAAVGMHHLPAIPVSSSLVLPLPMRETSRDSFLPSSASHPLPHPFFCSDTV